MRKHTRWNLSFLISWKGSPQRKHLMSSMASLKNIFVLSVNSGDVDVSVVIVLCAVLLCCVRC